MAKDAQSLLDQAKCYQCYASNGYAAGLMELSLLAQWDSTSPATPSWTPPSTLVEWTTATTAGTTNLEGFLSASDYKTCSILTFTLTNVTSVSILGLTQLAQISIGQTPLLGLDVHGLNLLSSLQIDSCVFCASLNVAGTPSLVDIQGDSSAFIQGGAGGVDDILHQLVLNGTHNGNVDLSGGTSAAPSAGAAGDIATLKGRGWGVITN